MALSSDLISQFVKMTKDKTENKKETIVYGTIQKDNNGNDNYVNIDGSNMSTPVSKTVVAGEGDRVTVMIKNHTATVTGNLSNPSARNTDKANANDLVASNAKIANLESDNATIKGNLSAQNADIENLKAANVEITGRISANEADIEYLKALDIDVDTLKAAKAFVEDLKASDADIDYLVSTVAEIDSLIFGSASGNVIQTSFSNSVIAQLGDAQIKSAMIESVSADKITAGDIITNNVRVMSEDGKLVISDETLQISDSNRVRVQIGKDASNDYSINVWDQNGKLMFSKGGITDAAIKEAIIRNDMVSDTANIHASKLDIDSLFSEINDSSNTIKSTKVYLDDKKQTLDVAFKTLTTEVFEQGQTISSQGTAISTIQGQISSKIWQQDINTVKNEMSTQYSTLEQEVDSISSTVASNTTQISTKANSSTVNTINNKVTSLEQNLDGFKTTVSNTYATKSEIGGRNLYTNTSSFDSQAWVNTASWPIDGVDSSGNARRRCTTWAGLYQTIKVKAGETYTLSAILVGNGASSVTFYATLYDADPTNGGVAINNAFVEAVKDYGVIPTSETKLSATIHLLKDGYLRARFENIVNNSYMWISSMKLERGSESTDWSPAPEDVESYVSALDVRVTTNESSITQLSDRITANVTATTNLGTRMSTVEQTADDLSVRLDSTKKQLYHSASGTAGTVGYVGLCTIKVNGNYCNRPILFELNNRGQQSSNVSFCFMNDSGADPALSHIQYDGGVEVWAYKTAASTWTLIAKKSEAYDTIYVKDFSNNNGNVAITWTNIHYSELPTSDITAGTLLAGKLRKSMVDNAAKTATNYLNFSSSGLVIGDMTASTLGKNVLIDSDSVDIRNGTTTLASFGADYLYLAKNSRNATIDLCNGLAKLYHQSRLSYDTLFVIETPNATEIRGTADPLCVTSTVASKPAIKFANADGILGSIGMVASGTESYITRNHPSTTATYSILDTGNYYKLMDSGWFNGGVLGDNFTVYNDNSQVKYRKIGKQVQIMGTVKPRVDIEGSTTQHTIFTLPSGYRPPYALHQVCYGSNNYTWRLTVNTNGTVCFSRYGLDSGYVTAAVGHWINFQATFFID